MQHLENAEENEQNSSLRLRSPSVRSQLRIILHESWKYKAVLLTAGLAYWLLYAFSAGMLMYYAMDVTPYLKTSGVPNPLFLTNFNSLNDLYYTGVVWFPNGHLETVFLFGTSFFSVLFSILFGLSILLIAYALRLRGLNKKPGFIGLIGMIPAIFTGGCCVVPIGTLLFGSIIPSTLLIGLEYGNPFLTNLLIGFLMFVSIIYTARKVANDSCLLSQKD